MYEHHSLVQEMSQYDPTCDLKINVGYCDLCNDPMILLYILKTFWCMNIIFWDNESVWHDILPQNICRSVWPIFHGPVIVPYILKLFSGWTFYFGILSQCDLTSDLKIFGPLNLPYIFKTVWCMNIILWDYMYESVWHNIWPRNKCRSLWPIVHGPVILPYYLVFDGWMSYFWKMSQCNTNFDLKINYVTVTYISWSSDFSAIIFCSEKHFSFIGKARFRRATLSYDSSYCML